MANLTIILMILSSLGTIGAFWVSYCLYGLQQSIENSKKPLVKVWFRPGTTNEGNVAALTMVNFGENPLPIKQMDVANDTGTHIRYNLLKDGEQIVDWLVQPNQVHTIAVLPYVGRP